MPDCNAMELLCFALLCFVALYSDLMYMKAFLLTYRSFATPELLLAKLIERYHVPPREDKNRTKIQLRVCNTIKVFPLNLHRLVVIAWSLTLNAAYRRVVLDRKQCA
jgi:hypothetical protein